MNFSNEETNEEETKQRMLSLDYGSAASANVWLHHSASAGHIPPCNNNIEAMDNSIPLNSSPLSTSSNGNAAEMRSSNDGDAEGVWSPDIDQAFHEALQIYPPCGRRKIILSDEGKMYGRNELIARYIKLRCGKSRTRKQVSSHIQVLARKKQREEHSRIKTQRDNTLPETNANSSSASTTSSVSNNHTTASVSATILPSSNNSLQQQKQIKKAESEDLIIGHSLPSNSLNILPSSPNNNNQIQNISLAVAASQQPLANLITSINRDQIASVQAQVARAASAITQQNWPSLIVTNNNNNQHLMAGAQLYMAASSNPCSSVVASIPAAFVSNGNCQLNTNSSSSEQIIFTTTPSSAFTCATTINTKMTTIASPNLILNGFTAYIEEQNLIKNRERREEMMEEESIGQQRIELVHIPKNSETPFERISLELIQSKYPPILQELFKRGPSDAFFLAKCWANMNFEINDEQNALFAVDSYYESNFGRFDIIVSTKVCSFGNEVVEKVEIYSPIEEDEDIKPPPLWHFRLEKSPMCEYMVRFISELKKLQEPSLMNSVLENFTILQIVSNKQSEETLMVVAFIFEVREDGEDEIYTNIYRLTE